MPRTKHQKWTDKKNGFNKNFKYPKQSGSQQPLIEIKNNLDYFSNSLYSFFLNGFPLDDPQEEKGLERSPEYPPEYVLQNILTQTSFDLRVIRDVIYQRNINTLSERLDELDTLAIQALSKFSTSGVINSVRPYAYFNRDTNVRVIPYANALFIGVPMDALTEIGDLPAISHEVGHHIYKNGKIDGKTLDVYFEEYFRKREDIVPPADRWILNWLEEIFADLCNVISAGPIAALTIQDILEDNLTEDLKKDDGAHPPGYIRPYVSIEILKLALQDAKTDQGAVNQLISQLEERWQKARYDRNLPVGTEFQTKIGSKVIGEQEALDRIAVVVQGMYQELQNNFGKPFNLSISSNGTDKTWSHLSPVQKGEPVDLDAIYESFDSNIEGLKNTNVKRFIVNFESSQEPEKGWAHNRNEEWDPNTRLNGETKVEFSKWKGYIQTLKWSEIFGDTRPVSGPE